MYHFSKVSLLLNTLFPSDYGLFKSIRMKGFHLCAKPLMEHLLHHAIICKSDLSMAPFEFKTEKIRI
jgi:hypothetical protein